MLEILYENTVHPKRGTHKHSFRLQCSNTLALGTDGFSLSDNGYLISVLGRTFVRASHGICRIFCLIFSAHRRLFLLSSQPLYLHVPLSAIACHLELYQTLNSVHSCLTLKGKLPVPLIILIRLAIHYCLQLRQTLKTNLKKKIITNTESWKPLYAQNLGS